MFIKESSIRPQMFLKTFLLFASFFNEASNNFVKFDSDSEPYMLIFEVCWNELGSCSPCHGHGHGHGHG